MDTYTLKVSLSFNYHTFATCIYYFDVGQGHEIKIKSSHHITLMEGKSSHLTTLYCIALYISKFIYIPLFIYVGIRFMHIQHALPYLNLPSKFNPLPQQHPRLHFRQHVQAQLIKYISGRLIISKKSLFDLPQAKGA